MEKQARKIPTSRLSRMAKVSGLAMGLGSDLIVAAGKLALQRDKKQAGERFHRKAAERLLDTLGRMKGLPMKAGQMISYLDRMIPEPRRKIYREVLSRLQVRAVPFRWKEMEALIRKDTGKSINEAFASFDKVPVAAASIGQVYRARLHDGREVAVKVQYPGIANAIRADLKNIGMLRNALRLIVSRVEVEQTLADISDRILEECDYGCELCNLEEFYDAFAGDPDLAFPQPIPELCGERVLVAELFEGKTLDEIREGPQEAINRVGSALFRYVFASVNCFGLLNGDPHPGNFLVLPSGKVGCLDFGCVQRFDRESVGQMAALRHALVEGKRGQELRPLLADAYGLPEDLDDEEWAYVEEYVLHGMEPVLCNGVFRFDEAYMNRLADLLLKGTFLGTRKAVWKGVRHANRPGLVFIGRVQLGLFGILSDLKAQIDCRKLVAEVDRGMEPEA